MSDSGEYRRLWGGDTRTGVRSAQLATGLLIVTLTGAHLSPSAGDFPELRGPYLGQKPPGRGAEIFAAGMLKPAEGFHSSVVTPDGRYLFFLRVNAEVNDVYWTDAHIIDGLRPIGPLGK
jgi:hypothetical protein